VAWSKNANTIRGVISDHFKMQNVPVTLWQERINWHPYLSLYGKRGLTGILTCHSTAREG